MVLLCFSDEVSFHNIEILRHQLVIDLRNESQTINTVIHIYKRAYADVTSAIASKLVVILCEPHIQNRLKMVNRSFIKGCATLKLIEHRLQFQLGFIIKFLCGLQVNPSI